MIHTYKNEEQECKTGPVKVGTHGRERVNEKDKGG
jgi:hypothetical protein